MFLKRNKTIANSGYSGFLRGFSHMRCLPKLFILPKVRRYLGKKLVSRNTLAIILKRRKIMKCVLLILSLAINSCSSRSQSTHNYSQNGNISLPPISEVIYIETGSKYETLFPPRTNIARDFLNLKFAQKQLEDIKHYKVYLVALDCANNQQLEELCDSTIFQLSFIVFYNSNNKTAEIVNISYDLLSDSETYSMTYVLKKKKIIMYEEYFVGGEEDENGTQEVEPVIGNKYILTLNKMGEIIIKTIANPG